MEKAVLDFVVEQTNALIAAPTTAAECKAAAEAWLASDKGEAANKAYIAELEADIMPLDGLIAFAESPAGAHGRDLKAAGKLYCDCPACTACEAILGKKDQMI